LRGNEIIQDSIKGYISGKNADTKNALMTGRLIVTDQRICFYRHGFVGEKFESIDRAQVESMETSSSSGQRSLKLCSLHNDLTFSSFRPKAEFDKIIRHLLGPVHA